MHEVDPTVDASLKRFLSHFNFDIITVSIQIEEGAATQPLSMGKYFPNYRAIRAFSIDQFFSTEVQKEIKERNAKGYTVYFKIHEGNGKPESADKLDCGRNENIVKLKTFVIDTDKVPYSVIKERLLELNFTPHLVVNSSVDKYHLYFLIEEEAVTTDTRRYWESVQRFLHSPEISPHIEMDQSIRKLSQELRLPGYYHQKMGKPFTVTLIEDNTAELPRYKLKETYDRLKAYQYDIDLQYLEGDSGRAYSPYVLPEGKIKEGGRHEDMVKFVNHLVGNFYRIDTPDKYIQATAEAHAREYYSKCEDLLEGGSRAGEIAKIIKDTKRKRQREKNRLDGVIAGEVFKAHQKVKDEKLPDSFYLGFPGDLGVLTRFIYESRPNLSLEMCFAGALCVSGAIKAESFICRTSRPFVNGFILASTGTGKTTLITAIEQLLSAASLRGEYSQVLEHPVSVQALHEDLYRAGGFGTLIIDEAGDYIQGLNLKSVSGFSKGVRPYCKKATSPCDGQGVVLSPGRSKNNTDPSFKGKLAMWLFSQPSMFYSSLDLDSVNDGFIPRFFIFKGENKYDFTSYIEKRSVGALDIPIDIQAMIEALLALKYKIDYSELDAEVAKELESKDKKEVKKIDKEAIKLAKLYNLKAYSRLIDSVEVEITSDAERLLIQYLEKEQKDLMDIKEEKGDGTAEEALITRTGEMITRLVCNAASWDGKKAVADFNLVEKCIEFYAFQRRRFLGGEAAELYKTWGEKQSDLMYTALSKASAKTRRAATLGEILKQINSNKRPDNPEKVMAQLELSGRIASDFMEHSATKKRFKVYYIVKEEEKLQEVNAVNLVN